MTVENVCVLENLRKSIELCEKIDDLLYILHPYEYDLLQPTVKLLHDDIESLLRRHEDLSMVGNIFLLGGR